MKDLPSVSAFPIEKELNNTQDRFYGSLSEIKPHKDANVISKINDIFSSPMHIYKSRVKLFMSDDVLERTIVGKTSTDLLTMNGEHIKIKDILDIERL